MSRYAIITLAALWSCASAYKLTFYQGEQCRSMSLGSVVLGPDQGCRNDFAGVGQSVIVGSTGSVDDGFMLVLFSSDDCNPDTIIDHKDSGCAGNADTGGGTYLSYEVWNVMEDEQ